jgi:hypothetical protein
VAQTAGYIYHLGLRYPGPDGLRNSLSAFLISGPGPGRMNLWPASLTVARQRTPEIIAGANTKLSVPSDSEIALRDVTEAWPVCSA